MMSTTGTFITFEGGEGAGKTTAINLLAERLKELGVKVLVTREPGGIPIAERIREVILDTSHTSMDPRTEALLYAAARRQHLVEKVIPALNQGNIVLCDRFVDSSLVYQGFARGLGMDAVKEINAFAIQDTMPELTFWFDINPVVGLARITSNDGRELNRLDQESMSFHLKVREGYAQLAKKHPERIVCIDAAVSTEEIIKQMIDILREKTRILDI